MNKYWLISLICWSIALISWSIGIALLGIAWQVEQDKLVIEAERQIDYNQGYYEGYDRGYQEGWKLGYDKGKLDGEAPYKSSTNETISIDEALAILVEGKRSHQYYIDHPNEQTFATGNTTHNQLKVRHYTSLEELVKWLAE